MALTVPSRGSRAMPPTWMLSGMPSGRVSPTVCISSCMVLSIVVMILYPPVSRSSLVKVPELISSFSTVVSR